MKTILSISLLALSIAACGGSAPSAEDGIFDGYYRSSEVGAQARLIAVKKSATGATLYYYLANECTSDFGVGMSVASYDQITEKSLYTKSISMHGARECTTIGRAEKITADEIQVTTEIKDSSGRITGTKIDRLRRVDVEQFRTVLGQELEAGFTPASTENDYAEDQSQFCRDLFGRDCSQSLN